MKYYCKNCKSEFTPGNEKLSLPPVNNPSVHCPFCEKKDCEFEIIPDYETPEQYEKRTGKPYPDQGVVFALCMDVWLVKTLEEVKRQNEVALGFFEAVVIADPPVPPPDDWRPK